MKAQPLFLVRSVSNAKGVMDCFQSTLINGKDGISLVGFWNCHGDLVKVLEESGETVDRALCTTQKSS